MNKYRLLESQTTNNRFTTEHVSKLPNLNDKIKNYEILPISNKSMILLNISMHLFL